MAAAWQDSRPGWKLHLPLPGSPRDAVSLPPPRALPLKIHAPPSRGRPWQTSQSQPEGPGTRARASLPWPQFAHQQSGDKASLENCDEGGVHLVTTTTTINAGSAHPPSTRRRLQPKQPQEGQARTQSGHGCPQHPLATRAKGFPPMGPEGNPSRSCEEGPVCDKPRGK